MLFRSGITPHPPRDEISKTALGAEEWVSWEYYHNPLEIIKVLKLKHTQIIALEQSSTSVDYRALRDMTADVCIVLGNEIGGVSPDILALADSTIEIPMLGRKQSLNVATAAGICMYELVRE